MVNRTDYINDYKRKNYKRVSLELPKELHEEIKSHLSESESVNGFIKTAIKEKLERDNSK